MELDQNRLSDYEIEERATEAQVILNNRVFNEAVEQVYSRALGILLSVDVGSLTATQAHAIMKSVFEVKKQLEQFVTDRKMRQKYNKSGNTNG